MTTSYPDIFKPLNSTPLTLKQHFWQMVQKSLSDRVLSVPTVRKATKVIVTVLRKTTGVLDGLLRTTKNQYPELLFNTALLKDQQRYDRPQDALSRLSTMPTAQLTEEQRAACEKQHAWYRKAQRESVFPEPVSKDKEEIAKAAYEADRKNADRLKMLVAVEEAEEEMKKMIDGQETKLTSILSAKKKKKSSSKV